MHACVHIHLENEVDGEGFLLLTDGDMGEIVKPLGVRHKLITKRNMLACVSTFVAIFKRIYSLYSCSQNNLQVMCIRLQKNEAIHGDDLNSDDNSEESYHI